MRITYDLHTHTVFSHGEGSVRENIECALRLGLKKIAITDHAPSHLAYGIRETEKYLNEISRQKSSYKEIEVLSGIELNLVDSEGGLAVTKDMLDVYDIRIFGYHKLVKTNNIKTAWQLYVARGNAIKNTIAIENALRRNDIDILAHPGYGLKVDLARLAKVCAQTNTLMEINQKHAEFSAEDIRICAEQGAKFIVSSDAHTPQDVGQVDTAINKAILARVMPVNVEA